MTLKWELIRLLREAAAVAEDARASRLIDAAISQADAGDLRRMAVYVKSARGKVASDDARERLDSVIALAADAAGAGAAAPSSSTTQAESAGASTLPSPRAASGTVAAGPAKPALTRKCPNCGGGMALGTAVCPRCQLGTLPPAAAPRPTKQHEPVHAPPAGGEQIEALPAATSAQYCPNCGAREMRARRCDKCGFSGPTAAPKVPIKGTMLGVAPPRASSGAPLAPPPPPTPRPDAGRSQGPLPEARGATDRASVVVLASPQTSLVGRRFVIPAEGLDVGRIATSDVPIEADEEVSASHCRLTRNEGAVYVLDLGSTNGTYLGDAQVTRQIVAPRDVLRLGRTVLQYIDGEGADADYHRVINEVLAIDGLTKTLNQRAFAEELGLAARRAISLAAPLCLVIVGVDDFAALEASFGTVTGDTVLVEVSRALGRTLPSAAVCGRHAGSCFGVLLPGTARWDAIDTARRIVDSAGGIDVIASGDRVPVTLSAGVAMLRPPWTSEALLDEALRELTVASQSGHSVAPADRSSLPDRSDRRLLDGPWLVRRALVGEARPALVAFEVDDEALVLEGGGVDLWRLWFRELVEAVDTIAESNDLVGTWQNRYALCALGEAEPGLLRRKRVPAQERARALVERVTARWTAGIRAPSNAPPVVRQLRSAILAPKEVFALRERALEQIVVRLLKRPAPGSESSVETRMPYPLAVTSLVVGTRSTAVGRAMALTWGLELALRFVVAVELAALRTGHASLPNGALASVIAPVAGRPLSMGTWVDLARALSELCLKAGAFSTGGVSRLARDIASGLVPRPGQVSDAFRQTVEAVARRNANAHGPGHGEESYDDDVAALSATLDALLEVLRPLEAARLVSVEGTHDFDDDDRNVYSLRDHRGPFEHFAITQERLRARLRKGWCHLIQDTGDVLSLAPLFGATTCGTCRRPEVFVSDEIVLGPQGAAANLRGVTSNHRIRSPIPWNAEVAVLFDDAGRVARMNGASDEPEEGA